MCVHTCARFSLKEVKEQAGMSSCFKFWRMEINRDSLHIVKNILAEADLLPLQIAFVRKLTKPKINM
jgi:hypothetical protein